MTQNTVQVYGYSRCVRRKSVHQPSLTSPRGCSDFTAKKTNKQKKASDSCFRIQMEIEYCSVRRARETHRDTCRGHVASVDNAVYGRRGWVERRAPPLTWRYTTVRCGRRKASPLFFLLVRAHASCASLS